MGRTEAARPIYSEEIEEVHMDERIVGKLQSDVEHIRSDISRIDGDIREIRGDIKSMKDAISELRAELKSESYALTLSMDRMRASQRLGFIVFGLIQLVIASGAPTVASNVLMKWVSP
jgi:peptidoglycan hydrolase CwlO-like protein